MLSERDDVHYEAGTVIDGKFEVCRVIGAGNMGAVVHATHLLRRAPVALKFMSPRLVDLPGVAERFLNEGVAASRIDNEHVVKVLDVSRLENGQPYLVMEFLDGEDLASLLAREGETGQLELSRAVHFVLQILRGLAVAHQAGIIHRDLKPANCFVVSHEGEPDFIKIVDFGISKVDQPDQGYHLTQRGMVMGTPHYVSPEQARDATNVDARSDLYSVAAMLYELVSGRPPLEPKSLADLYMLLATYTPVPLDELRPGLPPGFSALVTKGLSKQPADRFQSALEMAYALVPFADGRSDLVLRRLLARPSPGPWSPSLLPRTSSLPPASPGLEAAPTKPIPRLLELKSAFNEVPTLLSQTPEPELVSTRAALASTPLRHRSAKLWLSILILGLFGLGLALFAARRGPSSSEAGSSEGLASKVRASEAMSKVNSANAPAAGAAPSEMPAIVDVRPVASASVSPQSAEFAGGAVLPSAPSAPLAAPKPTVSPPLEARQPEALPAGSAKNQRKPALKEIEIQD